MTGDGERRKGTASEGGERERGGEREADAPGTERLPARVPAPTPEEAPELLGERSDYPIAWDGEER
jgi:hypothetical protein